MPPAFAVADRPGVGIDAVSALKIDAPHRRELAIGGLGQSTTDSSRSPTPDQTILE